jgi:hypothetical protein
MAELDDWPILLRFFRLGGRNWAGAAAAQFVDYVAFLQTCHLRLAALSVHGAGAIFLTSWLRNCD